MAPAVLINDDYIHVEKTELDPIIHDKSALLHRDLHAEALHVIGSNRHHLTLDNGQEIFDATGGAAVACLGHGDLRVRKALLEQMSEVSYTYSAFFATCAAEELAQLLVDSTYDEMARALIICSGSEAIEASLKLARQYHIEKQNPEPSRVHFISRLQSYHGNTLGALGVGGHMRRRALYEPMLADFSSRVSPCYTYRDLDTVAGETEAEYVQRLEAQLDGEFQRIGPHKVAAFFAEPVVGAALGCALPLPGYFEAVRRVCDKYGALLVLDEVMCGSGRIGPEPSERYPKPLHAWQDPLIGVVPDIMTMGKGLGGGYMPVAAMLANHKVVDVLMAGTGAFAHGQTYQGHPLACKAALAVQTIIKNDNLVANVREQGALLGRLLKQEVGQHPHVGDVRGQGLFWAIEFVKDKATKEPFDSSRGVSRGIHKLGMSEPHNISLYACMGAVAQGDYIILAPAYIVTADEVRTIVKKTADVVNAYFASHGQQESWL